MSKKWSAEMIIKFLEGYENLPCLWDVHSQSYKNKEDRDSAYQKLSELTGIDGFGVADVKAKIRSIRNAYALELAKIKKSRQPGTDEDKVYKPKVPWFSIADRFLQQVIQTKESLSFGMETETQSESIDSVDPLLFTDIIVPPMQSNTSSTTETTQKKPISAVVIPERVAKRAKTCTDRVLEELQTISQSYNEKQNNNNDEYDYFGKLVSCQLGKLSESVALESMSHIHSYLINQRLKPKNEKKLDRYSSISSPRCYDCTTALDSHGPHEFHTFNKSILYFKEEPSDIM